MITMVTLCSSSSSRLPPGCAVQVRSCRSSLRRSTRHQWQWQRSPHHRCHFLDRSRWCVHTSLLSQTEMFKSDPLITGIRECDQHLVCNSRLKSHVLVANFASAIVIAFQQCQSFLGSRRTLDAGVFSHFSVHACTSDQGRAGQDPCDLGVRPSISLT